MKKLNTAGFTLSEIMVVVIILGILAAIAIPNYQKSIEIAHERDAITQLRALHAAQSIYQKQTGVYYPASTTTVTMNQINTNLGLNLIANDMTYTCTGHPIGATFTCNAVRNAPATSFTVQATNAPLSATNPACVAGVCP